MPFASRRCCLCLTHEDAMKQSDNARAVAEEMPTKALICVKQPAQVCFATLSPLNLAKFSVPTANDQGTADPWQ
jgi:hypothetical protein